MSGSDTLDDLLGRKRVLLERKKAIERVLDALTIVIESMSDDIPNDTNTPRGHNRRNEITNAIFQMLTIDRPLHRKAILEKLGIAGFHIGGVNPVTSLGAYLSLDPRFTSVSRGYWSLTDESEIDATDVTPEGASLLEHVEESKSIEP